VRILGVHINQNRITVQPAGLPQTFVVACLRRPESSIIIGHARAIPKGGYPHYLAIVYTALLGSCLAPRDGQQERRPVVLPRDRIDQSYDCLISACHGPNWSGKNGLHGCVEFVLLLGDRLATPIVLRCRVIHAQIVNFYNDGVPRRGPPCNLDSVEWVGGGGYVEAASASVTETVVVIGTECKLVDR